MKISLFLTIPTDAPLSICVFILGGLKMKKVLSLIMVVLMLSACGKKEKETNNATAKIGIVLGINLSMTLPMRDS